MYRQRVRHQQVSHGIPYRDYSQNRDYSLIQAGLFENLQHGGQQRTQRRDAGWSEIKTENWEFLLILFIEADVKTFMEKEDLDDFVNLFL